MLQRGRCEWCERRKQPRWRGKLTFLQVAAPSRSKLPAYQRPYFVRLQQEGTIRVTGTFKHQKVAYRDEGYDPKKVQGPLYFLDGDRYVPLDDKLFSRLQSGELRV